MLLALLFAAATATAAVPGCTDQDGWNRGRAGDAARSECGADYQEAHRLGTALRLLDREHAQIEARVAQGTAADAGPLRRRQRQIDIDREAIRGLATIHGWPIAEPAGSPP